MVQKISKKTEPKALSEITENYLEEKGYFRFGNYTITKIVHDYLYLVEDFLLEIDRKVRQIPTWVVVVYLKVMTWTLDRPLSEEELGKYCELLRVKSAGDCLLADFKKDEYTSKFSYNFRPTAGVGQS